MAIACLNPDRANLNRFNADSLSVAERMSKGKANDLRQWVE